MKLKNVQMQSNIYRKYTGLIFLFVLGVLAGVVVKLEASKHLTTGYWDPLVVNHRQNVGLDAYDTVLIDDEKKTDKETKGGGSVSSTSTENDANY